MPYSELLNGRWSEPGREYFVTTVVAGRQAIFTDLWCARILIRTLRQVQQETDSRWLAWVLMPDHFHGLLSLGDEAELSSVIRAVKGRSALLLNKQLNRRGRLWQQGYYEHALRAEENRLGIARYIVANPLRKGLVKRLGDYPHWDSVWL
jgi:putative transposase